MDSSGELSSQLPQTIRLLCVSEDEPSWVGLTMQLSSLGCHEPQYRWSSTPTEAFTILRQEIFDALIIVPCSEAIGTEFGAERVLDLLRSIRTGGHDEPVLLAIDSLSDSQWGEFASLDCEILISPSGWDSPAMVPLILKSIRLNTLARRCRDLEKGHRREVQRDQSEAGEFFAQLRRMVDDMQLLRPDLNSPDGDRIPDELHTYYQQLLRTNGMMGQGSLAGELSQMADAFRTANLTALDVLMLHIAETEKLLAGIGRRSARHLMNRSDLLAIELLLHFAEGSSEKV